MVRARVFAGDVVVVVAAAAAVAVVVVDARNGVLRESFLGLLGAMLQQEMVETAAAMDLGRSETVPSMWHCEIGVMEGVRLVLRPASPIDVGEVDFSSKQWVPRRY